MLTPFIYYRTLFEQSPKNYANAEFTSAASSNDQSFFLFDFHYSQVVENGTVLYPNYLKDL